MTARANPPAPVTTLIVVTVCVLSTASARGAPATRPTTRPADAPNWVRLPPGAASVTVPLRRAGDLLFAPVRVNGKDVGWFLLDTGSTLSGVETRLAEELRLQALARTPITGTGGDKTEAELVRLPGFSIGPAGGPAVEAGPTVVAVLDMTLIGVYLGVKPSGVIGYDLLRELPFTLDTRDATLTLHDRARFAPPRDAGEAVSVEVRGGAIPAVPGRIEGTAGWFAFDTGLQGLARLTQPYFRLHPELLRGKALTSATSLSIAGTYQEASAEIGELHFFGRSWGQVTLRVGTEQGTADSVAATTAGRMGIEALRDARLTFDGPGKRLWCRWHPKETAEAMAKRLGAPDARDLAGQTPLMEACGRQRGDVVRLMLDAGADPNLKCYTGRTALMHAAGNAESIRLLLGRGADPNARASVGGSTPLRAAVGANDLAGVKALLAGGAETDKAYTDGTPLHLAAASGRESIAAALVAAGADVHARTKESLTPLLLAAAQPDPGIVLLLARAKADPNAVTGDGSTALMVAAHYGHPDVAGALLDVGAKVNVAKAQGVTPLMIAARQGALPMVRLLLERGADPAARSSEGKTALEYAAAAARADVTRYLAFYGGGGASTRPATGVGPP